MLGRQLGLNWSSMQNLVDQLRNVPFKTITDIQRGWAALDVPRGFYSFDWAPCVEVAGAPETRFLTDDPATLMRRGQFLQIPSIMGYTNVSSMGHTIDHVYDVHF
jgi:hypothetical protein